MSDANSPWRMKKELDRISNKLDHMSAKLDQIETTNKKDRRYVREALRQLGADGSDGKSAPVKNGGPVDAAVPESADVSVDMQALMSTIRLQRRLLIFFALMGMLAGLTYFF